MGFHVPFPVEIMSTVTANARGSSCLRKLVRISSGREARRLHPINDLALTPVVVLQFSFTTRVLKPVR